MGNLVFPMFPEKTFLPLIGSGAGARAFVMVQESEWGEDKPMTRLLRAKTEIDILI